MRVSFYYHHNSVMTDLEKLDKFTKALRTIGLIQFSDDLSEIHRNISNSLKVMHSRYSEKVGWKND